MMNWSPDKLSVMAGDVRLTYEVYGDPESPPMVLVHALFMSAKDWVSVAKAFAHKYRIYALNLRGHSDSDWPGAYSFGLMAGDVIHFLDALQLDRIILVGHSLGGIVSFFVAASQTTRVSALILEEAPPPQIGGGSFDFGSRPPGKLPYDWEAVTAVIDQLNHPDPGWWDEAPKISAPTLVISGGKTSHVPQEWNADMASKIPNGRLLTLGGGHFVHQNQTDAFINGMATFLADVETGKVA